MTLACPHCGYSREVDAGRLPAQTTRVNCPRCRQSFPLPQKSEVEAALPVETAPADTAPVEAAPEASIPVDASLAALTQRQVACSACGVLQPAAERCLHCGATFIASAEAVANHGYAGFWIRVVASMVDSLLVTMAQLVLGLVLGLTAAGIGGDLAPHGEAAMAAATWLFGTALAAGYYVFFTGYCGQTPGKMALRIKVIRSDGSELGYGRAALREIVGKFVSGIILGIGYLMVAFDERKQGLHDRMAGTYVIKL